MSNNQYLASAIAATRDIPRMPMSAIEILTFFPNHTLWFAIMMRLVRHDWTTERMARMQLHARGTLIKDYLEKREATLDHLYKGDMRHRH